MQITITAENFDDLYRICESILKNKGSKKQIPEVTTDATTAANIPLRPWVRAAGDRGRVKSEPSKQKRVVRKRVRLQADESIILNELQKKKGLTVSAVMKLIDTKSRSSAYHLLRKLETNGKVISHAKNGSVERIFRLEPTLQKKRV